MMSKVYKYAGVAMMTASLLASSAGVVGAEETNSNANANANTNTVVAKPAVDLACVAAAVDKRDMAMIAAWDKYSAAIKTALSARKDALKAAWALTDKKARNEAIRKAWNAYRDSVKAAKKTFRDERTAAWKQFRTDRRACGVREGTADEGQGQDSNL